MELTSQSGVTIPLNYKDRRTLLITELSLQFVKELFFIFYLNNVLFITE